MMTKPTQLYFSAGHMTDCGTLKLSAKNSDLMYSLIQGTLFKLNDRFGELENFILSRSSGIAIVFTSKNTTLFEALASISRSHCTLSSFWNPYLKLSWGLADNPYFAKARSVITVAA